MTTQDAIFRAQSHDLTGLNLAGIVRMSHELEQPLEEAEAELKRLARLPRTGNDIKGREVQDEDCRTYVLRRGGAYVYTYEEPDTSAWKRRRVTLPDGSTGWRVVRPVFEDALKDLKRGLAPNGQRLDGIVVYDLDRLTRDNRHLEDAIDVVMQYRRPILDTTGSIDLLTENGRSMARVLVAMSAKQSADTARRVARKHKAMQQAGIPAGGPRPFGWNSDRRTLRAEEAEEVTTAVERLLKGSPVGPIACDWNERGIKTTLGKAWTTASVIQYLRNPRLCGYSSRCGSTYDPVTDSFSAFREIVRDTEGNPIVGQWEAILSVSDWESVTAIIGVRHAPTRGVRGKNSRTYLLSSYLRCGLCGFKLRARKSSRPEIGFTYVCPSTANGGCGGISIAGPPVDQLITSAVINQYEIEAAEHSPDDEPPTEWEGDARIERLEDDLRQMHKSWRSPEGMDSASYFALLPEIQDELKSLKSLRKDWEALAQAQRTRPTNIRADWDGYALAQKRAYIDDVLIAVQVASANHRKGMYEERLTPLWRKETVQGKPPLEADAD